MRKINKGRFVKGHKIKHKHKPQEGFQKGHKFYSGGEKGWFKKGHQRGHQYFKRHIPWNKETKGIMKANSGSFKKGMISWMKGRFGKDNPVWKGGKSFEPYTTDWTETLKKSIRERDHYVCQICFCNGWVVHHIDYDKSNCNPDNLITLCNSCHIKTNFNRKYWIKYFNEKSY